MVDASLVTLITQMISSGVLKQLDEKATKEVIQRFLKRVLLNQVAFSDISFTRGAADFLAEKAAERIVTVIKREDKRKDAAFEAVAELPKIEDRLRKDPAAPRFDLMEIRNIRQSKSICGIAPWC